MSKTAIITGITGQDGFYLTNYLLGLGYQVVGLVRRTSMPTDSRLRTLRGSPNLHIVHADITDTASVQSAVKYFRPDEFYHLAAQSHVAMSWAYPVTTANITGVGVLNCLEAVLHEKSDCRFYFAGSSEQFGNPIKEGKVARLNESSPMAPESPYAAAKVFGFNISRVYRRSFN
ncbi:MAG: GDP-mannose 4,6-dehydratase, partial [Nitrososphaera sp.]|nr:GDP-mannose 4,6-dehydratase [Nitrososphaera sp.]